MYSFNDEVNEDDTCPPADEVMANGMDFLFTKCINPMRDNLAPEDLALLGLIGVSFKIIADQATAYEKLENGTIPPPSDPNFFRN